MERILLKSGESFCGHVIKYDGDWVIFQREETVPHLVSGTGNGSEVKKFHVSNIMCIDADTTERRSRAVGGSEPKGKWDFCDECGRRK